MKRLNQHWPILSLILVLLVCSSALAGQAWVTMPQEKMVTTGGTELAVGAEAKPMPLPRLERPAVPAGQDRLAPHQGVPLQMKIDPEVRLDGKGSAQTFLAPLGNKELAPQWGPCPASFYTLYDLIEMTAWPNRAVGKVLFTGPDGGRYMCTAAVVNQNLLLTAGHCVSTGGVWHTDFQFMPGYFYGPSGYGIWTPSQVGTTVEWFNLEDFRRDVAFMIMSPQNGLYISDVVGGWLGFASLMDPTIQWWNHHGYPFNLNDGEVQEMVSSAFGHYDAYSWTELHTVGVGSAMLGGASGGPWLMVDGAGGWLANGVNSYGYTDCEQTMYSPYFDQTVWDVYEHYKALQFPVQ